VLCTWDLIYKGVVAKIADNLYCGADSLEELLQNWKLSASKICHQPQIYCDLGLDLGLWHPPGIPASNCSPSRLAASSKQLAAESPLLVRTKSWLALYPSAPHYCHHKTLLSQVASVTRGLTCVMIYSRPFTVLSLPFPQATPSSSLAPMINCGSSPTVMSKLQQLVLHCTSPVTISYS